MAIMMGKRLMIPPDTPPEWGKLLKECWSTNPAERPNFDQIYARLYQLYGEICQTDGVKHDTLESPKLVKKANRAGSLRELAVRKKVNLAHTSETNTRKSLTTAMRKDALSTQFQSQDIATFRETRATEGGLGGSKPGMGLHSSSSAIATKTKPMPATAKNTNTGELVAVLISALVTPYRQSLLSPLLATPTSELQGI